MDETDVPLTDTPPVLTRTSSYASQASTSHGGTSSAAGGGTTSGSRSSAEWTDADLLGVPTDMDGNPVLAVDMLQPTSTLTDLVQTFWSTTPRLDIDLLDRKLKQASERVRQRVRPQHQRERQQQEQRHTGKALLGEHARDLVAEQRAEIKRLRAKVAHRVDKIQARWTEQKNIRLRDKLSFVIGVMNLIVSSLVFAYVPKWMPVLYSVQCAWFLPIRVFSYYRLHWHYFLFDYCYFANILNLLYIWVLPGNKFLFLACYCSSHGPLAFSIATWRNSAVFHSVEKMTSLFIHLYPPITFTAMRHFVDPKERDSRFPAIAALPTLDGWTAFAWNVTFYLAWQLSYYLLISRGKASKIASGERINSYSTMTKGKGAVAKVLAKAPSERREWAFIALQFAYTIICTLPAPLVLYNSRLASSAFCLLLILLSVWNGASYYVEVWGRRFERELDALRREIEATHRQSKSAGGAEGDDAAAADGDNKSAGDASQHGHEQERDEEEEEQHGGDATGTSPEEDALRGPEDRKSV